MIPPNQDASEGETELPEVGASAVADAVGLSADDGVAEAMARVVNAAQALDLDDLSPLPIEPRRPLEEEIIFSALANHEPLPMLDVIMSRVAGAYSPMLKSTNGFLSETTSGPITYGNWGQAMGDLVPESAVVIANSSWGGPVMLALDPSFLHGCMSVMLGGGAGRDAPPRRQPTVIERAFAQRLLQATADELAAHMGRIVEVSFVLEAVESPSQVVSLLAGNAQVAVGQLEIEIGALKGRVSIVLPLETLEPVRNQLGKMFLGEKLGGDASWRDHFAGHISGASMQVEVELGRTRVALADILQWRPGSTIDLGVTVEEEAVLRCSGIPVLRGVTGRKRNGRVALRITAEHGQVVSGGEDDLVTD